MEGVVDAFGGFVAINEDEAWMRIFLGHEETLTDIFLQPGKPLSRRSAARDFGPFGYHRCYGTLIEPPV